MELAPYIYFYGRCEEALNFYKTALGGTFEALRTGDSPMKDQVPPELHQTIMHATFTAPGISFMASDGVSAKSIKPDEGNISLMLRAPDRSAGERLFTALSDGGAITMPLADAFWGGRFGVLQDRFGNEWMVASP